MIIVLTILITNKVKNLSKNCAVKIIRIFDKLYYRIQFEFWKFSLIKWNLKLNSCKFREIGIMSKALAIAFLKAAENDQILLEKIKNANSATSIVKIAVEYGYQLTEAEILAIQTGTHTNWEDEELSEEQLEAVAGGVKQALAGSCVCGSVSCVCDASYSVS